MRLRLTVRRNGLPETPVVWNVDLETCTISQLLEQVNEAIPIESGDWGFEDYAVELKGNNGVNYECLHYQVVGKVMKEDDEVIIRPLLTQDIKIRRVSGRNQISSDGRHLLDGLAFGRPLLRRPADRPLVNIPPLKRRRITYEEEKFDSDDEGFKALKEKESAAEDSDPEENNDRQLILHADFDDDDSEDDEDFEPGQDDEAEGSAEETQADSDQDEQQSDEAADEEEVASNAQDEDEELDNTDEPGLRRVTNPRRALIRKLHSAFPTSSTAVCKYILEGTKGEIGEAYDAMAIGFKPAIQKGAIVETSQETLDIPKTRSKKRKQIEQEPEEQDSMQVELDDSINPLFNHYDQNGLPPGSISSGKALSAMAEVLKISPAPARPISRESPASTKSVKFSLDGSFSNGITSTQFIDREAQIKDADEDEVSSDTSSSGSSSEEESEAAQASEDTSTSGSDSSDDSSDSTSDSGDEPEETSSKPSSAFSNTPNKAPDSSAGNAARQPQLQQKQVPSGQGRKSTRARNQRRREANILERYKAKGILPAGTTITEFNQLSGLDEETSPGDALTALEALRSTQKSEDITESSGRSTSKDEEFEARRQRLLDSVKSGGIDVDDQEFSYSRASSAIREESQISFNRSLATTPSKKSSRLPSKAPGNPRAATSPPKEHLKSPSKISEQAEAAITPSRPSKSPAKSSLNSELLNNPPKVVDKKSPVKELEVPSISGTPSRLSRSPSKSRESIPASNTPSRKSLKSPNAEAETEVVAPSKSHTIAASDEQPALNDFSKALESPLPTLAEGGSKAQPEITEALQASELIREATPDATVPSKVPTPSAGSAKSATSTPRRSKLDLGAGRRLLFNALGVRAPKTKKDEEKLRTDLMKDVRPLITPKPVEETPKDVEDSTDEDPEAWREKINYRAVECCQEGVVLSEPPFPFEQRWDPQQQGGWSQKGDRGGKRKHDMRDQSQYYETQRSSKKQKKHRKDKHRHAEEQEYWEDDFEPSHQEDSMELDYGEPTQDTTVQSQNFDGVFDTQLVDDLNEDASAGESQGPADLAALPNDPLSLPDLEKGQAVPGMTIAFRHLIMDETTNWSPLVSPWVTAIVIGVLGDDFYNLTLAVRDRKEPAAKYDEETGERTYGRFEMPVQDDEEEDNESTDDGLLKLSYGQLMEPKVVQEAPPNIGHENVDEASQTKADPSPDESATLSHEHVEESAEAQFSHVTETPLHSDAPDLPEQDDDEPTQDSPQEDQQIKETQLDSIESDIPSHQPDVTQEPEIGSNEEVEQSYPSKLNSPEKPENGTALEEKNIQPNAKPIRDGAEELPMVEESNMLEKADESAVWNGFEDEPTTVAPGHEIIAACPMCDASLEGISPDLASRHINGCLDGNLVPLPEPAKQAEVTPAVTPSKIDTPSPGHELEVSPEPVSEEDRQEISRLIKDAGFRSAIDSSVLRDIRPEGVDSPGDSAIFDKSMKSMETPESNLPYSPKYSGLGSSPTRNPKQPSRSPDKEQQHLSPRREAQSSWQTVDSQMPSSPPAAANRSSHPRGTQSSWQTVDSQFFSSQPVRLELEVESQVEKLLEEEVEDKASWETLDNPKSLPRQRSKKIKKITRGSAFKDAQEQWESLQAKNRKPNAALGLEKKQPSTPAPETREAIMVPASKTPTRTLRSSRKTRAESRSDTGNVEEFPGPKMTEPRSRTTNVQSSGGNSNPKPQHVTPGLDGADERNATPTVNYPKLSVGSSFSSMVSDHGRQPDVNFDDSANLNMDTTKPAYFNDDDDSFRPEDDVMTDVEPEITSPKVTRQAAHQPDPMSEDEPSPPRKSVKKLTKARSPSPFSDESDSDDPFPPLEQLTQSQDDLEYKKAMAALDDADLSEEVQTTPKASQNARKPVIKAPAPRISKSQELPLSRSSTSRLSEPQAPQNGKSRVSASQPNPVIIDLTSSDTDDDDEEAESSGDAVKTFKPSQIDDHDEDFTNGLNGRARKNSNGHKKARRHTAGGSNLRASSQASLNTKRSRKTSRF